MSARKDAICCTWSTSISPYRAAALRASGTLGSNARVSINAARPYLGYAAINDRRTEADSNYNSMQVTFNKRMSQGLEYGAVYTWSKNMTNASTDRSDSPQDPLNLDLERAPSQFDRTHIFTAHVVYSRSLIHLAPAARSDLT